MLGTSLAHCMGCQRPRDNKLRSRPERKGAPYVLRTSIMPLEEFRERAQIAWAQLQDIHRRLDAFRKYNRAAGDHLRQACDYEEKIRKQ